MAVTEVEILEVEGDHDRAVGEGVMVDRRLVAVRPPLSGVLIQLNSEDVPAFRVRLDGEPATVLDVVQVLFSSDTDPLVAMEISSEGGDEPAAVESAVAGQESAQRLRAYLTRTNETRGGSEPSAEEADWDLCAIWPDASFCSARTSPGEPADRPAR